MNHENHLDPQLLAEWSLGQLDESEGARIRAHLEHCGHCQAEADLARDHFQTPKDARIAERSDDLTADFETRLATATQTPAPIGPRRGAGPPASRSQRLSWVLAAAAVAFAFLGLSQINSPEQPPSPSDQFLSTSSPNAPSVHIEKQTDGWLVSSTPATEAGPLHLTIHDDRGDVLYDAVSADGSWRLRSTDLGDREDGAFYFATVSGIDANGRRWVSDAKLLP